MNGAPKPSGLVTEITQHLGAIFRHTLPGVVVLGMARLAYPDWFIGIDLKSWQQLVFLGAVSIAVGNTWFAVNRYGLHQFVDYLLWLFKSKGPARVDGSLGYLDDLGKYASKSLHTQDESARARQHVAFRASTVLLSLTLGEVLLVLWKYHRFGTIFERHPRLTFIVGATAIGVGLWQMVITRRIDYFTVYPPESNRLSSGKDGEHATDAGGSKMNVSLKATVIRGAESWQFFAFVFAAFAALTLSIIDSLTLGPASKIELKIVAFAFWFYLFMMNVWVRNQLARFLGWLKKENHGSIA